MFTKKRHSSPAMASVVAAVMEQSTPQRRSASMTSGSKLSSGWKKFKQRFSISPKRLSVDTMGSDGRSKRGPDSPDRPKSVSYAVVLEDDGGQAAVATGSSASPPESQPLVPESPTARSRPTSRTATVYANYEDEQRSRARARSASASVWDMDLGEIGKGTDEQSKQERYMEVQRRLQARQAEEEEARRQADKEAVRQWEDEQNKLLEERLRKEQEEQDEELRRWDAAHRQSVMRSKVPVAFFFIVLSRFRFSLCSSPTFSLLVSNNALTNLAG